MSTLKSTTNVRFYLCTLPDAISMMPPCDRPLYEWAATLPAHQRPTALEAEIQRIRNAADQARFQQWAQCEASRYVSPPAPTPGVKVAVRGRLAKTVAAMARDRQERQKARITVHFARNTNSTLPAPPSGCPPLPYPLLHEIKNLGLNHYPQNTRIALLDSNEAQYFNGTGPWEGSKVFMVWSPQEAVRRPMSDSFRFTARIDSEKIFDHWATFGIVADADLPDTLMDRLEPFDLSNVDIRTSVAFDWSQPEGQRGHGWRVVHEYTHLDSARSWITDRFTEFPSGWTMLPMGGYGAQHILGENMPEAPARDLFSADGHWRHRVCIMEFIRPPTKVEVYYQNVKMTEGISSIGGVVSTPYIPGVTTGEAVIDETVTIQTVGATKASFRLIDVQPVPGIGVLFTLAVVNELHFPACIVTPFLSGLSHYDTRFTVDNHFTLAWMFIVRNVPATSESSPIDVLVPMHLKQAGDWTLLDRHWRGSFYQAYAAPFDQYPDGIYGFGSASSLPELSHWPPPAYKVSSSPDQYAFLLAGIRSDGERIWNSSWDGSADLDRPLAKIPAHLAPGAFLPTVYHPHFNAPSYADQVPFLCFYEWTAEANVGNDTWQPRSGKDAVGLDLATALARYGRYLTLNVSAGRPFRSDDSQRWMTAFETWPGDSTDTLETYLIDTYVRPNFKSEAGWRNFQYTSLKKPHLVISTSWHFESSPIADSSGSPQVLPVVKATENAETVDVVLM